MIVFIKQEKCWSDVSAIFACACIHLIVPLVLYPRRQGKIKKLYIKLIIIMIKAQNWLYRQNKRFQNVSFQPVVRELLLVQSQINCTVIITNTYLYKTNVQFELSNCLCP